MAKAARAPAFGEHDHVYVIVETPAGSRIKYSWKPDKKAFEASKVLPLGMEFPFDFGFVSDTKAADGDPLDALVIADAPLAVGCLVECRVLGAIELETSDKPGGKPMRNDRLIVVPVESIRGADWRHIGDLGVTLTTQIRDFLTSYVEREGRTAKVLGIVDRVDAIELVEEAR
jgi:inorganic pyrophosphatase